MAVVEGGIGKSEADGAGRNEAVELLTRYYAICLLRIWRAQRFSVWMTTTLHQFPGLNDDQKRKQLAELEGTVSSSAAVTHIAEDQVGMILPAGALSIPWSRLAARRGISR